MSNFKEPAPISRALRDRKRCRDWLMPHMALGQAKAFSKEQYRQLANFELGPISKASFDDAWKWAIEDSGRQDWYKAKRNRKEALGDSR